MEKARLIDRVIGEVDEGRTRQRLDAFLSRLTGQTLRDFPAVATRISGKSGIEVGGPSPLFRPDGAIPIYGLVGALDGCNFGNETVWEGKLRADAPFQYLAGKPAGRQFVAEATAITGVPDETYDFVISSHCLEHVSNPLNALKEWRRLLKPNGTLLLIVPDPRKIFDHRRPPTPFEHLLEDYETDVGEDDLTHLDEILRLHDYEMDPACNGPAAFHQRSLENEENRCLHHHVFTPELAQRAVRWGGFRDLFVELNGDLHIVVLAEKISNFAVFRCKAAWC